MNGKDPRIEFYKQKVGGSWITQGLWVAAELGIADLLNTGPLTVDDLSRRTSSQSDSLSRVLRALSGVGVFAEDEHGRYCLTPLADLLRTDVPGSQRALLTLTGAEFHAAWGELLHSVRTGEPGFHQRFGMHFFEYMMEHPARRSIYDAAMESVHGGETEFTLDAYDFNAFATVADVGGGNGSMLAGVLDRHPSISRVLFDLPSVVERTQTAFSGSALTERIRFEGGDVFAAVPADADAYLLRHILHDWQDPEATTILRRCRRAARSL